MKKLIVGFTVLALFLLAGSVYAADVAGNIFSTVDGSTANGGTVMQGQTIEVSTGISDLVNPEGLELRLVADGSGPGLSTAGEEICEALFGIEDCNTLMQALAVSTTSEDTYTPVDGLIVSIANDAPAGEWSFRYFLVTVDESSETGFSTVHGLPEVFNFTVTTSPEASIGEVNYDFLQDAVDAAADPEIDDVIELNKDIVVSEQITISNPVTIEGNGFTLSSNYTYANDSSNNSAIGIIGGNGVTIRNLIVDGSGGTGLHGINVFESTSILLEDVTLSNNTKSGLTVNGSTVTADNLVTLGNSWGAVNVDIGSEVIIPAVFILNSGDLAESNQIWSDGANVTEEITVTVNADGYNKYAVGGAEAGFFWTNRELTNTATISKGGITTAYGSIQDAVDAAESGDTITVAPGTYDSVNISSLDDVLLVSSGTTEETIIDATGNGSGITVQVAAGAVTVDGFTIQNADSFGIGYWNDTDGQPDHVGFAVRNNILKNNGADGIGFGGSKDVVIENNIFINNGANAPNSNNGNGILAMSLQNAEITNNVFDGNADSGIYLDDLTGSGYLPNENILVRNNVFTNHGEFGIHNTVESLTVNAINNYWGTSSTDSTDIEALISGEVTFDPWYVNASKTVLSNAVSGGTITATEDVGVDEGNEGEAVLPVGVTELVLGNNTTLDLSAGAVIDGDKKEVTLKSGTSDTPVVLKNSTVTNVSVVIPDNTKISGPTNWDGKIQPPKTEAPSGDAPAGFSVGSTIISVGSSDGTLLFDEPVTLLLEGVTGTVGYKPAGSNTWVEITEQCSGDYATPDEPSDSEGECYINNGTDTKIVTFHFTTFGSLVVVSSSTSPASSGGGAGSATVYCSLTRTTFCQPISGQVLGEQVGQVLGASIDPVTQAQIDAVRTQLITLIQQLISLLQAQIDAQQE